MLGKGQEVAALLVAVVRPVDHDIVAGCKCSSGRDEALLPRAARATVDGILQWDSCKA